MISRRVFSNVESFFLAAKEVPAILDINTLRTLKPAMAQVTKPGGCGCNKGKLYNQYKPAYEAAMSALSPSEIETLKKLLGKEQVCYYKEVNGALEMRCL